MLFVIVLEVTNPLDYLSLADGHSHREKVLWYQLWNACLKRGSLCCLRQLICLASGHPHSPGHVDCISVKSVHILMFTNMMQHPWWRHQMETFSVLLAICAGNSPVPGEFPTQRPVTRSFDVYFDLHPNSWLSKQSWGWWFETLSCSLWRHRNALRKPNWPIFVISHGFFPHLLVQSQLFV